jgi:hypothetical protein
MNVSPLTKIASGFLIAVVFSFGFSSLSLAKKGGNGGGKPPPPPPPPPESCADADGDFPAFAYIKKLHDGRHGTWSGNELYLADSTGTCAVKIFTLDFREVMAIRYRQNGNKGRIVWMQHQDENKGRKEPGGPVLKLLGFTVNAGEVSNITHTLAWKWASDVGPTDNNAAELSPDGNTAYFTLGDHSQVSSGGDAQATVRSVDLTSCTIDCPANIIESTLSNKSYWSLAMNTSGSRLYFVHGGGVGFVDTATKGIRYIAKKENYYPLEVGFDYISTGHLVSGNDAIAVTYSRDLLSTIDIFDVDSCSLAGTTTSDPTCLAEGDSTIVQNGIHGWETTFFNDSWLLVGREGNIDIVDINSLESTPYVVDGNVGGADSAE